MYNDRYSHFVPIPILWTNLVDLLSPELYTKSQPGSGEENITIWAWQPSCSMVWNHMNSADTLLTEGPMRNLVKLAQAVSEKKTFKNSQFHTCI